MSSTNGHICSWLYFVLSPLKCYCKLSMGHNVFSIIPTLTQLSLLLSLITMHRSNQTRTCAIFFGLRSFTNALKLSHCIVENFKRPFFFGRTVNKRDGKNIDVWKVTAVRCSWSTDSLFKCFSRNWIPNYSTLLSSVLKILDKYLHASIKTDGKVLLSSVNWLCSLLAYKKEILLSWGFYTEARRALGICKFIYTNPPSPIDLYRDYIADVNLNQRLQRSHLPLIDSRIQFRFISIKIVLAYWKYIHRWGRISIIIWSGALVTVHDKGMVCITWSFQS